MKAKPLDKKTHAEKRKGFLISMRPSIKKKSQKKAIDEGKTLSDVVENLLFDWSAE